MRRLTWLLLFLPLAIFAANQLVFLTSLEIQPAPLKSTFTFIMSQRAFGKVTYLSAKQQVMIDFENTVSHFKFKHSWLGDANVKMIDSIQVAPTKLRFVLNVRGQIKYNLNYEPNVTNGARLKLEIISIPQKAAELKAAFDRDLLNVQEEVYKSAPEKKKHIFTVVIDAGHGGHDSGAIGADGMYEKNVVLSISKKLATEINQMPNMRAILTRRGDYFIPLRERLRIARKNKADLFIAIHADAHYDKEAEGISIFALSQHGATSEAARWLAQRENYSELNNIELNSLQDRSPQLRSVLIDLAQTVTIQDSMRLGSYVLDALDDMFTMHYKRVEQAPFVVLKAPDVPSILVETGFLTNPREERRLKGDAYQHQIVFALQQGIEQYVKNVAEEQQ